MIGNNMAKARLVNAGERAYGLVTEGHELDCKVKDLTFRSKGVKKLLSDEVDSCFENGDRSIVVDGDGCQATIIRTEKYKLNGTAEEIGAVRNASESGLLGNVVKTELQLNVPPGDRERSASILRAAGINATTMVEVKVVPEEFRIYMDSEKTSAEQVAAKTVLENVAEREVSYRITYKKK
jgi:hypothetical protein